MSVTYTNRKGRTYYLCQGVTKRGNPRYYFSREPQDTVLEEIPPGYEVRESVNGVVSLAKSRPLLLLEAEVQAVRDAVRKHAKAKHYRVDAKPKRIIVYEHIGPGWVELVTELATELGIGARLSGDRLRQLEEEELMRGQFSPIMRFILTDAENRRFKAQRMCFLGGIENWIDVEYDQPVGELASRLIPTLGTDAFFELF